MAHAHLRQTTPAVTEVSIAWFHPSLRDVIDQEICLMEVLAGLGYSHEDSLQLAQLNLGTQFLSE